MIKYNLKLLFNNRILIIWPAAAVLLAILGGIFSNIQPAGNSYSFLVSTGMGVGAPSGMIISGLIGFFVLIAVIAVPSHLNKNLKPEQAALIFSKPVSRSDFFFAEFGAVLIITLLYSLVTVIALAVLLLIEAGIFPFQLYLAMLLFIPLYFLAIYISIVLFLVLTRSYLASVFIGYLVIPFIASILLRLEFIFKIFGWESGVWLKVGKVLTYLIPSAAAIDKLIAGTGGGSVHVEINGATLDQFFTGVLYHGFAAFDWSLFILAIVSCLPFLILSYYLMIHKEF